MHLAYRFMQVIFLMEMQRRNTSVLVWGVLVMWVFV